MRDAADGSRGFMPQIDFRQGPNPSPHYHPDGYPSANLLLPDQNLPLPEEARPSQSCLHDPVQIVREITTKWTEHRVVLPPDLISLLSIHGAPVCSLRLIRDGGEPVACEKPASKGRPAHDIPIEAKFFLDTSAQTNPELTVKYRVVCSGLDAKNQHRHGTFIIEVWAMLPAFKITEFPVDFSNNRGKPDTKKKRQQTRKRLGVGKQSKAKKRRVAQEDQALEPFTITLPEFLDSAPLDESMSSVSFASQKAGRLSPMPDPLYPEAGAGADRVQSNSELLFVEVLKNLEHDQHGQYTYLGGLGSADENENDDYETETPAESPIPAQEYPSQNGVFPYSGRVAFLKPPNDYMSNAQYPLELDGFPNPSPDCYQQLSLDFGTENDPRT